MKPIPTPISPHAQLRPAASVHIRTFEDGESVLLHTQRERYFSLNASGTRMWQAITTAPSLEAAYRDLLATYEVDEAGLRRDLDALVTDLLEQQLLEVRDAEGAA